MEPVSTDRYINPELYDLAYVWYDFDIAFYVERALEARGPVLEVACGTGRVLIPTLQKGVDIDGFDLSIGMLRVLERKAKALGLESRVIVADMRDFTMPRRYALITVPFRAFMHLYTTEDQLRALRCMREHLEPGGALVLNLFHPTFDALVNPDHPAHQAREIPDPETGLPVLLRTTRTDVDRVNQMMNVEREMVRVDTPERTTTLDRHGFSMRWTYKAEMELLLRLAGFSRWEVRGGFDGRPLERDTDEMVWTAWKD